MDRIRHTSNPTFTQQTPKDPQNPQRTIPENPDESRRQSRLPSTYRCGTVFAPQAEKITQATVLRLKLRDSFSKVVVWATFTRAVVGRQIQLLLAFSMVGTPATRRVPVRATNRGACCEVVMRTP